MDTNVVSEIRKAAAGRADEKVVQWAESVSTASQWLSVITIHEIELGVAMVERRDAGQGAILRRRLDHDVLSAFANRILPVDVEVGHVSARCHVRNPRDIRDTLIAATASVHDLTVVTRNTADFEGLPTRVINPWT